MRKTLISKRDLDAMIRTRLAVAHPGCAEVVPMPVVWRARGRAECNWMIPGWTGDSEAVRKCIDRLNGDLRDLRRAYDIPDEQ